VLVVHMRAPVVSGYHHGEYKVAWRAHSTDGKSAEGSYSFTAKCHHVPCQHIHK
jgi:methionine-rich copper-binding protein CopC